jgi:hypothetical protein
MVDGEDEDEDEDQRSGTIPAQAIGLGIRTV